MKTKNLTPFPLVTKLTSRHPPQPEMMVAVKATFTLAPGKAVTPLEGIPGIAQPPPTGDVFAESDDERTGECLYPSDFADFKLGADVMLRGSCHTPGGAPLTECPVRFSVGAWSKMLRVLGPRRWEKGVLGASPSKPQPFTTMPLGWANAFGGPHFPANPAGKGIESDDLPNVELAFPVLRARGDRLEPAGFGPLSPYWPLRAKKVGKQYDKPWKETRKPYFAADFDWTHFHAAPPDQQLPAYLRGDETLELTNLHPDAQTLSARLPGLRVRVFADLEGRGLVELRMHLDTLIALPDDGHLVLVWRGVVEVADRDFTDVRVLLAASEPLASEPLPASHYQQVLAEYEADPFGLKEKLPPELAGFSALMKPGGKLESAPPDPTDDPISAAIKKHLGTLGGPQQAEIKKAMAALMAAPLGKGTPGQDPADVLAAAVASAAKAPAPAMPRSPGAKPRVALGEAMRKAREQVAALKKIAAERGVALPGVDRLDAFMSDPKLAEVDPGIDRESGPVTDEEIGPGRDLSGRDLSDRDLSGRDLRGANLEGAILTRAKLVGANLTEARLAQAMLLEADLTKAVFRGADLTQANLEDVRAAGADFSLAKLDQTFLAAAHLEGATLDGAHGSQTMARGADLTGVHAHDCRFDQGIFEGMTLRGADLSGAILTRCFFADVKAEGARFDRAMLTKTSFSRADLTKASFAQARGDQTIWLGARLDEADLSLTVLPHAHFSESHAREARLHGADLRSGRFYRASLERCDFTLANLMSADFGRATLSGTRFTRASLYDAKLLDASSAGCDFEGANLKRSTLEDA